MPAAAAVNVALVVGLVLPAGIGIAMAVQLTAPRLPIALAVATPIGLLAVVAPVIVVTVIVNDRLHRCRMAMICK